MSKVSALETHQLKKSMHFWKQTCLKMQFKSIISPFTIFPTRVLKLDDTIFLYVHILLLFSSIVHVMYKFL